MLPPTRNPNFKLHPTLLDKKERYYHVIQALLDYNEGIILNSPAGASQKFQKLLQSPFTFMRGTSDLMYRDFEGTDADKPIVLCLGDVHLENYGVMETSDGQLIWGLNDFDEAHFAPFTWDVKRGAISTILAAEGMDFSDKKCKKLASHFVKAYIQEIEEGLEEKYLSFYKNDAPKIIQDLLQKAKKVNSQEWLAEYIQPNIEPLQFKRTKEIQPFFIEIIDERRATIQAALDKYCLDLQPSHTSIQSLKLLDIATKTGSGTASIGLWRYYALVEATFQDHSETIILEIKQQRPSVLKPYIGEGWLRFSSEGARVAFAENTQLPDANPFYGYTTFDDISYLVRKRSPHKKRVNLSKLNDYQDFKSYTKACGMALADAHLRSNHVLETDLHDLSKDILKAVHQDTFHNSIADFSYKMSKQIQKDWKYFRKACEEGVFDF